MSSFFEINHVLHREKENQVFLRGKTKRNALDYFFEVTITHHLSSSSTSSSENNEGCIYVSDNAGGQYEMQVLFFLDKQRPAAEPTFETIDFNYTEYRIPPYVWVIVTGMLLAEL